MMSSARAVRRPRLGFDSVDLPVIEFAALELLRVHSKDYPASGFRKSPAHRFSHPNAPAGLLYLGECVTTCLWECFGDELLDTQCRLSSSRWHHSHLSHVRTTGSLRICDLADEQVRLQAGTDLGSLMHPDLSIPQAWGLAIQTHPAHVDGIRYLSRFDDQPSFVLFERPGIASQLEESLIGVLPDIPEADRFLIDRKIALV